MFIFVDVRFSKIAKFPYFVSMLQLIGFFPSLFHVHIFSVFSPKEVDLGVNPLTLTYERFSVVDYTQPYMEDGMSILMKRPDGKQSDLLQSYRVFAESTWLAFAVSFILSFMILTIVNKGSAYIRGKNKVPKPTRTYKYNFWLMFGYSLQEGQ